MGPSAPPKCLLTIGEKTLLQITLESLRAVGVREFVVVVGYQKEGVIAEAKRHAANARLAFVENPRYAEGAILSLWAARGHLDGEVLIMDADVLCPPAAFERLVQSVHPNSLLVDTKTQDTGEEQIVLGQGGRVLHITKRPTSEMKSRLTPFGESVGFLKLSREGALVLRGLLEEKVAAGMVNIEHEQVYPQLFEKVTVGFETMEGLPWIEIDTPEDLKGSAGDLSPLESPHLREPVDFELVSAVGAEGAPHSQSVDIFELALGVGVFSLCGRRGLCSRDSRRRALPAFLHRRQLGWRCGPPKGLKLPVGRLV
jgi:choline kinase